MSKQLLRARLLDAIRRLDPSGEVVRIDQDKKKITYNKKIKGWDQAKFEDEGFVRAYLVAKLIKELDYPLECIELEVYYNIGSRPNDKSAFLDVLVRDRRDKLKTYLFIECKTPTEYEAKMGNIKTQLFNMASIQDAQGTVKYLTYYTVDDASLDDRVIMIDYQKCRSYEVWLDRQEDDALNEIPKDYGIATHAYYVNVTGSVSSGCKKLNDQYTDEKFQKLKSDIHNTLWGGGSSSYNDVFFVLMKLLVAKIYDESMTSQGKPYRFQIYYEDDKQEDSLKTFTRISELYTQAQKYLLNQPFTTDRAFVDLDKISLVKVISAIKLLQGISFSKNKSEGDILGKFFESIITSEFKQDKGQFFTHWILCRFIVEALDIKGDVLRRIQAISADPSKINLDSLLPYIIDISAGSGTFLVQAIKSVSEYYLDNVKDLQVADMVRDILDDDLFVRDEQECNKVNKWANKYVYAVEPNPELATACKLNLIFHGIRNANIFIADGLASFKSYDNGKKENKLSERVVKEFCDLEKYETNEMFDFVIGNPPFSLWLAMSQDYNDRFIYSDKKNSENLFIERWWQLLRHGGRLGVVLPDSVFDTTENKYIREFLYRHFKIDAIISIDKSAFQPFTSTKVSILLGTKKSKEAVETYSRLWDQYSKEYIRLRNSKVVQFIFACETAGRVLDRLCKKYNYPPINSRVIDALVFSEEYKRGLIDRILPDGTLDKMLRLEAELSDLKKASPVDQNLMSSVKGEYDELVELVNKNTDYNSLIKSVASMVDNDIMSKLSVDESVETLKFFLREYYPKDFDGQHGFDRKLFRELLQKSFDDILKIAKQDYPNWSKADIKKYRDRFVNIWWVFANLAEEVNYTIMMAEAEHIGYKRTIRGEKSVKNELMVLDKDNKVVRTPQAPSTILDFILGGRLR